MFLAGTPHDLHLFVNREDYFFEILVDKARLTPSR